MKSNFIFLFCLQTVLFSLFSCNLETFGEPYYDPKVIWTTALSYQGIYSYDIGISADEDIYDILLLSSLTESFQMLFHHLQIFKWNI